MGVTLTAMAIPAKRGLWRTITLADGTEVRAELVGDEHGHWLRAADGKCYVQNGAQFEVANEETLQARRETRLQTKQAKRKAIVATTSDGLGKKGTMSRGAVPSIGEYTIPVVMVQFSDLKFKSTTTIAKMTRYYNEEGYSDELTAVGSVRDFFVAQSGGQFVPHFEVVGIVTLSKSYSYYGQNDSYGNDKNLDELPRDVVSAAVSQLGTDFSKFVVPAGDNYHTRGVPLLAMLYAGRGEATEPSGGENYLWPCEWDANEDPIGYGTYQGVHFNSFFIGNELNTGGSRLMGPAIFCHEFGHALGLPDFYCTDNSYSNDDPFGFWSLMDSGAYVDEYCFRPMGYNAYEKSYMGWLELKEIGSADAVTLQTPFGTAEGSAVIVRNSSTETFILENRQPGTWYPAAFESGVLVSRIAYSSTSWSNNRVNVYQNKKRACALTANGAKLYYSASSANLYGNNGRNSIASLTTYSGSTKDIGIKKITKNADGTITLTLNETPDPNPNPDPDPEPEPEPEDGVYFYESFDQCAGTGGNDGVWMGTGTANSTFLTDKEGWSDENAYGASQCARFGTKNKRGTATTPAFSLNGTATLTFRAGAWNANKDGNVLNLSVANGTITPSSVTMTKGEFNDFTAEVRGTGSIQITFSAAGVSRFFLDEVLVKGIATDVQDITISTPTTTGHIYTLDGRYAGIDTRLLSRGLYIIDGKKVVVK